MTRPDAREVLARLVAGNQRFVADQGIDRDHPLDRARATEGQSPIAAVLACSDSRVPVETVFDVGIGELFVVRSAGGVLDDVARASLRYAIEGLETPVVLVLGHEGCGAIEASLDTEQPAWLRPVTEPICSHIGEEDDPHRALGLHVVKTAEALADEFEPMGAAVLAAVYGLSSGEVHWLRT